MPETPAHPALADALDRPDARKNVQLSLSFGEAVDPGAVRKAWGAVMLRHPVLRSGFLTAGPEGPRVRVLPVVEPSWEVIDWQAEPAETIPEKWSAFREGASRVVIDVVQASCLKVSEIVLPGGGRHYLLTYPGFLLDEFSTARVLIDWLRACGGEDLGDASAGGPAVAGSAAAWKPLLGQDISPVQLRVRSGLGQGEPAKTVLGREESEAFKEFCGDRDLDPAAVLQAVWGFVLRRHGATGRLMLSRFSVRGESAEAGCYEAWLPAVGPAGARVLDDLREATERHAAGAANAGVRLRQILDAAEITDSDIPVSFALVGRELNDVIHGALPRWINFDVRVHRDPPGGMYLEVRDGFRLELTAGGGGLDTAAAAVLLERLVGVLSELPGLADKPWNLVPVLRPDEIRAVRAGSRPDEPLEPDERTIPELFHENAVAEPDRPAILDGDYTLTYGELDSLSDRLAAHLAHAAMAGGWNVGLFLSQSSWAAIGLLGSWKAGNSVIPLDPAAPPEWIEATLASHDAAVVLCDAASAPLLDTATRRRIVLDQEWDGLEVSDAELPKIKGGSPAAVLPGHFDGEPPVLRALTHGLLAVSIRSGAAALEFRAGDSFLAHSAAGGGAFLDEWLIPLVAGGTVRIADDALVDPAAGEVTHVRLTAPEWANQAARWTRQDGEPGPLRVVAVEAGNPNVRVLEVWERAIPGAVRVFWSPAGLCGLGLISRASGSSVFLPAGGPAPCCEVFLCDEDGQDVPAGFAAGLFLRFPGWKDLGSPSRRGWTAGISASRNSQGQLTVEGRGNVPGYGERLQMAERLSQALDAHVGAHLWTLEGPAGLFNVTEWPLTRGGWIDESALPRPEEKKVAKATAVPTAQPASVKPVPWNPLVVLREKGNGRRLVLVPGATGDPGIFAELAGAVSSAWRVAALKSRAHADPDAVHPTVEAAAAAYLAAVLEDDPGADFVLAGYGTGGTVAFEMVRQMAAAGRSAPTLVLIGATAPEVDRGRDWLGSMKSAVLRLATKQPPEPAGEDSPVFFAHEQVWRRYRAQPTNAGALLILPSDFPAESAAGWQSLCSSVRRESMRCRWDEMLGATGVKRLASILEAV